MSIINRTGSVFSNFNFHENHFNINDSAIIHIVNVNDEILRRNVIIISFVPSSPVFNLEKLKIIFHFTYLNLKKKHIIFFQ